jgi:parvulin-like peptidyl-prolyl isomerase
LVSNWKQIWEDLRDSLIEKPLETKQEVSEKREIAVYPPDPENIGVGDKLGGVEHSRDAEIGTRPDRLGLGDPVGMDRKSTDLADQKNHRKLLRVGLVLAALVLLAIFGRSWLVKLARPEPPAENIIATFDGGQLTIADVENHISQLVPEELSFIAQSADTFISTVEHLVIEELVKRWASQRQPDSDEDFRHTMQHINEDLNLQSFESQLHEGDIQVTESEIRAYYDANRDSFGVQTINDVREQIRQTLIVEQEGSYIDDYIQDLKNKASVTRFFDLLDAPAPSEDDLVRYYNENRDDFILPRQVIVDELQFPIGEDETEALKEAEDALLKIRGGTPFESVSEVIPRALTSMDSTVPEGSSDSDWEAVVFALTEEELSDVFRTEKAFYIVRVQEILPGGVQPYEDVRSQIHEIVAQEKAKDWFQANESKTLFTIKGRQYTVGQFYREYQELPLTLQIQYAGVDGMKNLAEELIERLLLVEDTYDQLLNVENENLAAEARLQVLQQMLHQEEIDDNIEITDEEIQSFYEENSAMMSAPPQMRIRYIRIGMGNSQGEITSARDRIHSAYARLVPGLFRKGEDFAVIAQEYSEDPETAANGGELKEWIGESSDFLTELEFHPFHEAFIDLPEGEISPPFEFDGSLYIVQVIERTDPETLSLDEVRPAIDEFLRSQKHDQLLLELQNRLLEEANVVIYSTVIEDYLTKLSVFETPTSLSE